jgi:hypothetical protein
MRHQNAVSSCRSFLIKRVPLAKLKEIQKFETDYLQHNDFPNDMLQIVFSIFTGPPPLYIGTSFATVGPHLDREASYLQLCELGDEVERKFRPLPVPLWKQTRPLVNLLLHHHLADQGA